MLGAFSFFVDGLGGQAAAAGLPPASRGSATVGSGSHGGGSRGRRWWQPNDHQQQPQRMLSQIELFLSPAIPLAGMLAPCSTLAARANPRGCRIAQQHKQ
jgi:hypothetical protein